MIRTIPYVKTPSGSAAGFFTKGAAAIVLLFVFLEGVWYIVLPEGLIRGLLEDSFDNEYVYLRSEGFEKGLFYNFSAAKLFLRKKGAGRETDAPLLEFDDLKGRFDFLSVFAFGPELTLRCRLNHGEIAGRVALTGRGSTAISGSDIRMDEIPFLESLGVHAEGILSGSFLAEDNTGTLKVSLGSATFRNASLGGVFLPLEIFHEVKGAATIANGAVELQSLAMSGNGVYGRVSGNVRGGNMNMNFELMTEPSFRLDPLFQAMIERYKVSPGYYVFPLRGEIPHGQ